MQRNVKAEITIMQLYLACLLQYQSLPHTAIPFLKFIVLEKCCSSLILTFASKPVGGEKFLNCLKIHMKHSSSIWGLSFTILHSLFPNPDKAPPTHTPCGLPSFRKQTFKEQKQRQKRRQHRDAEHPSCYPRRTRAPREPWGESCPLAW